MPGIGERTPSRSCCVCPNSAISAATRRRSPAWRRSTTTAAGTRDSATSPAGGRGCAARSTPPHCRGMPLEPGADGTLCAPHPGWKTSQARARRLRPKAPHLRQHACHPRHSMDRKASPRLMVATLAANVIPRHADVGDSRLNANPIRTPHSASGKRTMNPSRFGIFTLGKVSAFIASFSPMSLFWAKI